jgi:hypothetical protein
MDMEYGMDHVSYRGTICDDNEVDEENSDNGEDSSVIILIIVTTNAMTSKC